MGPRSSARAASSASSDVHMRKGVHRRLARCDALEAIAHHGFRRDLGGSDAARDLGCRELVEAAGHCSAQFFKARPAEVPAILPNTAPEMRPDPPG